MRILYVIVTHDTRCRPKSRAKPKRLQNLRGTFANSLAQTHQRQTTLVSASYARCHQFKRQSHLLDATFNLTYGMHTGIPLGSAVKKEAFGAGCSRRTLEHEV
jgi:hypothetical protein